MSSIVHFRWAYVTTAVLAWPVAFSAAQATGADPADREELLWQRVAEATRPAPATQPFRAWLAAARQQRETLLDTLRLYQTLYPGGRHREAAVRMELTTRFELATLGSGSLDEFRRRIDQLLSGAAGSIPRAEAAYWQLVCHHIPAPPAPPDWGTLPEFDESMLAACHDYVRSYPDSRYTPRLAELLFDVALRRDDRATMQSLVSLLRAHFPSHATTTGVEGRWRRYTAVGQPLWPELPTVGGSLLHRSDYLDHPLVIVVWAGFDEPSRRCVRSLEQLRRTRSELRIIGFSLDETGAGLAAACQELEIDWPQCSDGLGWGSPFVRHWGIDRLPVVFVLDRAGRLLGTTGADGWEPLVRQALRAEPVDADALTTPAGMQ